MTTRVDSFLYTQNPLAGNWMTFISGGLRCAGAGAYAVQLGFCGSMWRESDWHFSPDQTSEIIMNAVGNFDDGIACVRCSTDLSGRCYGLTAELSGGNLICYRYYSNTRAEVNRASGVGVANGDRFRLEVAGNQLRAYKNNALVGGPWTDNNYADGQPGVGYNWSNTNVARIVGVTLTDAVITDIQVPPWASTGVRVLRSA